MGGFTLVELLVGLSIMAVIAAMAWRGVDGISRSRAASQEAGERTLRLNTAIAQWEHDLLQVEDTGVVPPLAFDGATLRLTRRHERGAQVVAWTLRAGSWWRWPAPRRRGPRRCRRADRRVCPVRAPGGRRPLPR